MHFWLLLFQVLILFVAVGVFLLKFVENPLAFPQVNLLVNREMFMIMAGTCNHVVTSFRPRQHQSVSKLIVFVSFSPVHTTTPYPF